MTVANSFGSRADRAQQLAASGKIRIDGNAIMVPSSDGKREYAVRLIDGRVVCNCQDFLNRQRDCKHVLSAKLFAAQQAEESKR